MNVDKLEKMHACAEDEPEITASDRMGNTPRSIHRCGSCTVISCRGFESLMGEEERDMAKHTPGPWRHEADDEGDEGYWEIVSDTCGIAHIHDPLAPENGYADVLEANARLIAAAPDLLDALKFQMSWRMRDGSMCCCAAGEDEDEPKGAMPDVHSTACERARAAIAKAEGAS